MKHPYYKKTSRGSLLIIIAIIIMAVILLFTILLAAAMIGDRTGAGSGSKDPGGTGEKVADEPIVPGGCTDVITAARSYLGRGIYYSRDGGRCGPANSKGPEGVRYMDCSGYASRVYRDAGLLAMNACLDTAAFARSGSFQLIATSIAQAKTVWKPGDFILFDLGPPGGPLHKGPLAHIVIFGGQSGGNQIIYESGGSGGGPHVSTHNVFGGKRASRFSGVFRAVKVCDPAKEAVKK